MENIFRCSICKKEYSGYDAEKDCLNDEINCLNLKDKLDEIVKESIKILEEKYKVKILEEKHNVQASSSNHGQDYEIYEYFNGVAEYKGNIFKFYTSSDSVGDGRCEPTLNSTETLVNNFIYKYLREKEIESNEIIGVVEFYEDSNIDDDSGYYYYDKGYKIGNQNVENLMYDLQGKKVRIEVIE